MFNCVKPLCSSFKMKCVKNVKADNSICLKPCSGLFVNSFSKSQQSKMINNIFPNMIESYNSYKKFTDFPDGLPGKYH